MRHPRGSDDGFTLVELLMTIVIMGLVIAPLCMALVQTLNTIPQSGAGIQHSTDSSRLQSALVDDIGQAQGIDVFLGLSGGWNAVQLHSFVESSPVKWSTNDYNVSFKCAVQTGAYAANPWNLFDVWASDSLDASGNVPQYGAASVTAEIYTLSVTNVNDTWDKVVVHRWVSTGSAPVNPQMASPGTFTDTDPAGYLTGYCNSASGGEPIAKLATSNYSDGGQVKESLAVTLSLHEQMNATSIYTTTILANPRPSGCGTPTTTC